MKSNNLSYQILLDYDGKEGGFIKSFNRMKTVLHIDKFISPTDVKIHQTRKGFHMRVNILSTVKLSNSDIVILQLLGGSDYKREAFNFLRVKSKIKKHWNILYARKWRRYANGVKVILSEEKPRKDLESLFINKIQQ